MKIVHSYWSKPSFKKENFNISDRNKGGWVDKKYNYMSWALSCLQFRQFYNDIELVTDKAGYDILINKLGLPYTSVKVVLDDLNDYHPDLWALGKIYAYSIQEEPFVHVDGDVYIWDSLGKNIEQSPLIAQNIEKGFNYYQETYDEIKENFNFIPDILENCKKRNNGIMAVNAGIIGGTDTLFYKSYTQKAFEFVNKNLDRLDRINIGFFNLIFEQFLFYAMAEEKQLPITFYKENINHAFDGLAEFTGTPDRVKYVHTVGVYKRMKYVGDLMAFKLQQDYPEYYFRILNLVKTYQD